VGIGSDEGEGNTNSLEDVREGMRYLQTYAQEGFHKLIIRQHCTKTIGSPWLNFHPLRSLTAVTLTRYDVPPEGLPAFAEEMAPLLAALRATADQLCLRWSELSHPADVLNNIADELDAH
jgi:hypothetical protein